MSSGSHLSREFFELVKSIGESKSKQEEDRIILREVVTLKKLFSAGKHKPRKRVEMLVRLLYVEMLGHDASFGYIHAVQMTAGANLLHKKTAYLVSGQTLHPAHELRFMMVNVSSQMFFGSCFCIILFLHLLQSLLHTHTHTYIQNNVLYFYFFFLPFFIAPIVQTKIILTIFLFLSIFYFLLLLKKPKRINE